jgi:hypothetical protein
MKCHIGEPLDRDKLFTMSQLDVTRAALTALDPVQQMKPHEMVAGISLLFAAICHRTGIDPQDAHTFGMRVMTTREQANFKANDGIQTIRDFAGLRLMGQEVEVA